MRCRARGRIALRCVLGNYRGERAADVPLRAGAWGKPELADGGLRFNLSHSAAAALIAVATVPVGVDIECLRAHGIDTDALCATVLHPLERLQYAALRGTARERFFFRCWTRKEAVLKQSAKGIGEALDAIHCVPTHAPAVLETRMSGTAPVFVRDLACADDFAAALCTPCVPRHIAYWEAESVCEPVPAAVPHLAHAEISGF